MQIQTLMAFLSRRVRSDRYTNRAHLEFVSGCLEDEFDLYAFLRG